MDGTEQPTLLIEERHSARTASAGPAELQAGEQQLECVGSLQVQRQMQLGFICGSITVPTDTTVMASGVGTSVSEAAIVPAISLQNQRAMAPLYRMLPTQTDLNTPLSSDVESEQISPMTAAIAGGLQDLCMAWGSGYLSHPLAKKCEALAVTALAGYGDEIDVVAPVDILKQIFKIPYSKSRVSVAVHRVGRTLILNTGPDMEESEKIVRRKKNRAKAMERSLFLRFAMQSVRAEACDCPPTTQSPDLGDLSDINLSSERSSSNFTAGDYANSSLDKHPHVGWQRMFHHEEENNSCTGNGSSSCSQQSSNKSKRSVSWSSSHGSLCNSEIDSLKKSRMVGEQLRDPNYAQDDSENHKRPSSEGFLRVFFWQLEELRMLLGSDLLLFSNEKHAAVSLHLWEIERQVTPLMWLDVWLDNLMASVPELAICYHHNGIVQGYELLKTDDVFLLKGLSEDGTVFFHPHVVQQNVLSVLRFLQENCKQDPGTYWLFKNAGEDLMQLFDLSVISKNCTSCSNKDEKNSDSLPPPRSRGKGNYSLPLGMLLYRLAHRLSLSQDAADKGKGAKFFKKCLELLDEQEHLFVRASAHEHVARLILRYYKELGSTLKPLLLESHEHENTATKITSQPAFENDVKAGQLYMADYGSTNSVGLSSVVPKELGNPSGEVDPKSLVEHRRFTKQTTEITTLVEDKDSNLDVPPLMSKHGGGFKMEKSMSESETNDGLSVCPVAEPFPEVVQTFVDPVSARLAAVHHVSQAIKALRWQRQLQDIGDKIVATDNRILSTAKCVQLVPVCVCGEIDCIEVCDIRECEVGPFMDQKLWQLVLLLGESYLALGQSYKEDGQLNRALRAAELACSVYGSMPQRFKDKDISFPFDQSSCLLHLPTPIATNANNLVSNTFGPHCSTAIPQPMYIQNNSPGNSKGICSSLNTQKFLEKGMFWGQMWTLVGDIYVDYQRLFAEKNSTVDMEAIKCEEPAMAQEVMKEVKRLRKKLWQTKQSCSICSLTCCSCQSDRVSSGNSASSSDAGLMVKYPRKQGKKGNNKISAMHLHALEEDQKNSLNVSSSSKKSGLDNNRRMAGERIMENAESEGGSCALKHENVHSIQNSGNTLQGVDFTEEPNSAGATDYFSKGITQVNCDITPKDGVKKDIFSVLQGPATSDLESNLLTAVDCYDAAVLGLSDMWQDSQELEFVLRKKGWVCNELGRRRLACGNMRSAEAVFELAIRAFRDVRDYTNAVLVLCNIGHGKRAAAEALVSQLDTWRGSGLSGHVYKRAVDDAKSHYGEALKYYGMAKEELKSAGQDLDSKMVELHNEVYTQYAHTYLRLGMLLATVERAAMNADAKVNAECKQSDGFGSEELKGRKPHVRKLGMSANDSIREAISLYESLAGSRAQEAAFARFQLACHHRDCCLGVLKMQGKEHVLDKVESVNFQQAKRYFSLAERYWQKALDYYKASTHPDMFLEILAERSLLCMEMAPTSHPNSMLELALSNLLDGKQALFPTAVASTGEAFHGNGILQPSNRVVKKFSQQLQMLLKTMLAAASSKNRKSVECGNRSDAHIGAGRGGDVVKLKEMYRRALKSSDEPDLQVLYQMWMS